MNAAHVRANDPRAMAAVANALTIRGTLSNRQRARLRAPHKRLTANVPKTKRAPSLVVDAVGVVAEEAEEVVVMNVDPALKMPGATTTGVNPR